MPIHSSATENPGYLKGRGERREEEEEEGEGVGGGKKRRKKKAKVSCPVLARIPYKGRLLPKFTMVDCTRSAQRVLNTHSKLNRVHDVYFHEMPAYHDVLARSQRLYKRRLSVKQFGSANASAISWIPGG